MDEKSIHSLTGYLDTLTLLKVIPNLKNFATLVGVIRKWAKNKGIYGNRFGYLGGYGWSILAGRICQMYPKVSQALEIY